MIGNVSFQAKSQPPPAGTEPHKELFAPVHTKQQRYCPLSNGDFDAADEEMTGYADVDYDVYSGDECSGLSIAAGYPHSANNDYRHMKISKRRSNK